MNSLNAQKIFFIGYNQETFKILSAKLNITGCAEVFFLNDFSINPANILFRIIYNFRKSETRNILEPIFFQIFFILSFFLTGQFKKYKDFLILLHEKKVRVVDLENMETYNKHIASNGVLLNVVHVWEMLPKDILFGPRKGTINIHPSMLPKNRGALPELWVLKNHEKESAVTFMVLSEEMDAGGILEQHRFAVDDTDNWESLLDKEQNIINDNLAQCISSYLSNNIEAKLQSPDGVTLTGKYEPYRRIDWNNEKIEDIYNKINIYPEDVWGTFCYSDIAGRKIYIKKTRKIISNKKRGLFLSGFNLCLEKEGYRLKSKLFIDIGFFDSLALLFKRW